MDKDAYIKQLEKENAELKKRIEELERILRMNSMNSSKPPSSDPQAANTDAGLGVLALLSKVSRSLLHSAVSRVGEDSELISYSQKGYCETSTEIIAGTDQPSTIFPLAMRYIANSV